MGHGCLDLLRNDFLPREWSLLIVYGLGVLLFGALMVFVLMRWLRLHVAAAPRWPSALTSAPRSPGLAVLRGRIASGNAAEGVPVATSDFELVLNDGTRVRCQANGEVLGADSLDEHGRPTAMLELTPGDLFVGDEVCVAGVLEDVSAARDVRGGYRDGARDWVLRAPAWSAMVVAQAPIAPRNTSIGAFIAGRWVWALLFVALGLHGVLLVDFHLMNFSGEVVPVQLTGSTTRTRAGLRPLSRELSRAPSVASAECFVIGDYLRNQQWFFVSGEVDCTALMHYPGSTMPFVVVPGVPNVFQPGVSPRIPAWKGIVVSLSTIFATLGALRLRRSRSFS